MTVGMSVEEHSSHGDIPIGSICNINSCGNVKAALDELSSSVLSSDENYIKEELIRIQKKYGL